MKNKLTTTLLTTCLAGFVFSSGANAAIVLGNVPGPPNNTGREGASAYTTIVTIDGAGAATVNTPLDYTTSGTVATTIPSAFSTTFNFTINGAATVDTTAGVDFGKLLTTGLIDRDNSGLLGIRSGLNNGIELNEGFILGLDATNLSNSLAWKVTGIQFENVNTDEVWTIVNRNDTSKSLTNTTSGSMVDVSSLNIRVQGGSSDADLVSIFASTAGSTNNFRISKFQIEAVPEPTSALLLGLSSALLFVRRRRH